MLFIMIEHYKWDDVRVDWFHGGTKLRDYKDKVMDVHFNRILWEIWSYGVTGFWECIKVFDSDGHGLFRIKDFGWFVCKDVWMAILSIVRWGFRIAGSIGHTSNSNSGNMMGEVDIKTLSIEQYLMLTQGNQAPGMVKSKFRMKEKDIEDMILPNTWSTKHELPEEDTDFVSEDESETGDQKLINYTRNDKPFRPKPQPEDEELSFDDDPDNWLKTKMERCICRHDKEGEEDALIAILKSLVAKCKAVYANKDTVDLSDDMQEPEVEHREVENLEKITLRWHVCKPIRVFYENKRRKDCEMWPTIMTDFLKIRYGNKTINDITRERRYYELVARNSEFKDNDSSHEAMMYDKPCDVRKNAKISMRAHHTHGMMRDSKKKNDGKVGVWMDWVFDCSLCTTVENLSHDHFTCGSNSDVEVPTTTDENHNYGQLFYGSVSVNKVLTTMVYDVSAQVEWFGQVYGSVLFDSIQPDGWMLWVVPWMANKDLKHCQLWDSPCTISNELLKEWTIKLCYLVTLRLLAYGDVLMHANWSRHALMI
ncbi:hypothetical protein Tco_0835339 [Tanacetum coccineum]